MNANQVAAEAALQAVVDAKRGGLEVVDELADEWRRLCDEGPSDQPFYRPEWIRTCFNLFAPEQKFTVITARIDGQLKAVLPLLEGWSLFCGLPARKLQGVAHGLISRFDLVRAAGPEGDAAVQGVWDFLKGLPSWDVIELPQVARGAAAEELAVLAQADGFPAACWESKRSPYYPIERPATGHDPQLLPRSTSLQRNLRQMLRKVSSQGAMVLHRIDRADPEFLERFYELERAGWKGHRGTAIALKERQREFYDEIARQAERFGYLSLYFYEWNGRIVAGHFGLTYRGRYFMCKVAYDEGVGQYAPGHLLVSAVLRDCAERGVTEYDMMGDDEPWKMRWTSNIRPHYFHYILRGPWGRILRAAKFHMKPAVKKIVAGKKAPAPPANPPAED